MSFINASEQQITIDVQGDSTIRMTFVYAKCTRLERCDLWAQINEISSTNEPWLIGGDFNTILRSSEKRGGLDPDNRSIQEFHECIVGGNLSEVSYEGSAFTWCNNQRGRRRIWQRLDRLLCNGEACTQFPDLRVRHLARMVSDHAPLLIILTQQVPYRSRFIFQRMWLDHSDLLPLVEQVWRQTVTGTPSFRVAKKLRRLKIKLKEWNWSVFGDVRVKVETLQNKFAELETRLQENWNAEDDESLQPCSIELKQTLTWESEMFFQKTRSRWLQEGDRNTKFFHAMIRERRRKNSLTLQQPDGTIINNPNQISDMAAEYFSRLFTASPYVMHSDLFEGYPATVSAEVNNSLCAVPSSKEIWESICSLSADSAPGLDGFTGHFFRGCWNIIQLDMVEMIRGFFMGDYLQQRVTTTSIMLLPKIKKPTTMGDYRPISLCTFSSKVVSKILASRLANFLPRVIDEQQFGFVKGRSIHESIALAQEMAADLDRRSEGGNIILKYDISKAYDRLEWRFLLRAMGIMGFSTGFQDLVYRSICNIRYRVCVNGFYSQEFRSSRGVRQGDPLSPLLFIIAQQILSYNLNHRQDSSVLSPYSLGRKVKPISHLFYADDMLIFTNGRLNSLQRLKQLMGRYEAASGQQINLQKSALYVSKRITRARITRIQRLTGCQAKQLPFKYLGAPIYNGRCRIQFFDETVEKFSSKIEGWHGRFLSFGGKITLLKAVLASLPIHVFSCMAIPKQIQRRIEGLMAAFLWSQNGQSRTHWVSWRKISRPIAEGGLGIRSVKDTIFGLHGKLAWKIPSQQSLWTRMILQKYGRDSVYEANNFRMISSSLWRNLFPHSGTC